MAEKECLPTVARLPGKIQVFCGDFIHATNECPMEVLENRVMGVSGGKIVFMEDADDVGGVLEMYDINEHDVRRLQTGQFIIPGFIDTHTHPPQYPLLGTALDKGLLEWLETYTFPTEAKFADSKFAEMIYKTAVRRFLNNGTTTACYNGTVHVEACQVLCDIIEREGQRAFVGKANMDHNCPEYYRELTENSVSDTKRFVENVLERKNKLVTPIIYPRFAVNCSRDLLRQLGQLAQEMELPIQTHMSECRSECSLVKEAFPESPTYADVFDQFQLLTPKTVLAHGVYLTDSDLQIIKDRKCGISHCANSNASLGSGILDVRKLLDMGMKVGLGTDVSGGYSPSLLDAVRTSLLVSKVLSTGRPPGYRWLTYQEAFKLATLGGAQVLGLDDVIGNFEVGKDFDALIIDCAVDNGPFDIIPSDTIQEHVQRFIYQGDDRNITSVFVAGRQVK